MDRPLFTESNNYILEVQKSIDLIPYKKVSELTDYIARHYGNILIFGNGGSSTTASHFAHDLNKIGKRAICLTDSQSMVTSIANDIVFDNIFSEQIDRIGKFEDIAIGISTSGRSKNIINGLDMARKKKLFRVAITGFNGGDITVLSRLNLQVDLHINVPIFDVRKAEDLHLIICHAVCSMLDDT